MHEQKISASVFYFEYLYHKYLKKHKQYIYFQKYQYITNNQKDNQMKRCFSLQNKEYDFDGLPLFPLVKLPQKPTANDWQNVPVINSFRARKSDDRAPAADFSIKFAVADKTLYIYAVCDTYSEVDLPMKDSYLSWNFDNSLELFFGTENRFQQFLFNAKGAKVYYLNRAIAPVPDEVQLCGHRQPGKWTIEVSMPADLILQNGETAFKVVMSDMNSILGAQYYDTLNNAVNGFGVLSMDCQEPSPEFDPANLTCNWELYRKITSSAYLRQELPVPDLATPDKIQSAMHHIREAVTPRREAVPQVDFNTPNGEIRPIFGVNFGPKITSQSKHDMNDAYRALGASSMRTHDVPLSEPGSRLVDTIFVFPLEHADPSDPANYYFDQTDYYFENTMAQGPEVYYRLGISIDHAKKRFTAVKVKDFAHYAEICAGIVRHYNKGWANGHNWNIKYWEIWNEPEAVNMWAGTFEEYLEFFVIVYKRLKSEFPEIKVGGFGAISLTIPLFKQLAEKCAEHGIAPDFISWHHYSSNMDGMIFQAHAARFIADAIGFKNAELHLTEWHYVNIGGGSPAGVEDMGGVDSAVFSAGVLAGWQDTPIDLSHYYTAGSGGCWAIFDYFYKPKKVYYALCQCGLLQNRYKYRVKTIQGKPGTFVIAGLDKDQNGFVMLGSFKNENSSEMLDIKGIPENSQVKISVLDEENIMQEIEYKRSGSLFEVRKISPSSLYIVTFNK